jgi:hypothetical protein
MYFKNGVAKYFLACALMPACTTDETFDPEFSKEQETYIILPGNAKHSCVLFFVVM